MTDPVSTRNESDGVPFVLADGQRWHLATPRLYYVPSFAKGTDQARPTVTLLERWDYPAPARAKVRAMLDAVCSDEPTFPLSAIVEPAIELVVLCHDVTPEEAADLFMMTRDEIEDLAIGMLRMFRGELPSEPTEEPANQVKDE